MTVIALTRELGTGGNAIAAIIAERLKLTVVDSHLVEHDIAQQSGMDETAVHRALEGEANFFERWRTDTGRLSRYTAEEIFSLAARGNVLIHGWGAPHLLYKVPHVVCARLFAPKPARMKRISVRLDISLEAARREIERSDAAHASAMDRFFGFELSDATHFSIILNTAQSSPEDCAAHIVSIANSPSFAESAGSKQILQDELLRLRVMSVIERAAGNAPVGLHVEVTQGRVMMNGAVHGRGVFDEVTKAVTAMDGVTDVDNRLIHQHRAYGGS